MGEGGTTAKTFLSDVRQPEVDFFHSWAVVLRKFSVSRLHNSKELSNTNFVASRYFKMKNTSPVDVRRSKTTLPKLPNDGDARRGA